MVVLICDQGTNNQSFLCSLEEVNVEKPFIKCNNKKVFVFYDPPHLLKHFRNNLKKGDNQFDGEKVCWKYIVDFFKFDKSQPIWMAPKPKEKLIELPSIPSNACKSGCTGFKSFCCCWNINFGHSEIPTWTSCKNSHICRSFQCSVQHIQQQVTQRYSTDGPCIPTIKLPSVPFLRRAWMFSAKSKHLIGLSFLASLDGKFASMLFFSCGNTCQWKLDLNSTSQIA